jgi:hypothetical protein
VSSERPRTFRTIVVQWSVILGVIAVVFFPLLQQVVYHRSTVQNIRRAQARTEAAGLVAAMRLYVTEYGSAVSGDSAQMVAMLQGQNQRKIVFFEPRTDRINANGELIDPWGAPYRFDLSRPGEPRIWSCGPDRKDDGGAAGSDDIVSWR